MMVSKTDELRVDATPQIGFSGGVVVYHCPIEIIIQASLLFRS